MFDANTVNQLGHPDPGKAVISSSFDLVFTWKYESAGDLAALYEKAKREQWDAATALPWDTDVDPERGILPDFINALSGFGPYERLTAAEKLRLHHGQVALQLSQFLHGEQAALIVASQLVGALTSIDAKHCASSQTMDEARHVEVFSRYLREKLEWQWPINESLRELLGVVVTDCRWDLKQLGMQIIIEGLAMAAFGSLLRLTQEPLLREIIRAVMRDESRHVAFGMLALSEHYRELPGGEMSDREDFIIYACELMRNRLMGDQIAAAMGWERDAVRAVVLASTQAQLFRHILFSRIVPNLRRLGLLTPRVRAAFERLDILEFEHLDPDEPDLSSALA